ncbi:Hypothetical predicted protein [Olea europaea subsp. europaea]|uniref:Uncharacterized protein n=1 Tax=Olea europaea subsp. europaea TaxID=158383 RepID=A0A8S0PI18_OLEEU|nr:Hypothetical predicted protein [Olea europaea subsp. europaea]
MSSPSLSPRPPPVEDWQQQQQELEESYEPVIMDQDPQTQIHEIENQPNQSMAVEEAQAEEQEKPEALKVQESFPELHVALPITDPHVAVSEGTVKTPSHNPHNRRGVNKRKKGKPNVKKQQAIDKKMQSLMGKLNPIPFIPLKMLDFPKHEKLLKKLGLWDFVHIEFARDVRVDLIAQLVATYDPKLRCSYVNEFRIAVNRADLARALKLPVKKEKGNMGGLEHVDLDSELMSDESEGFIEDFVSNWVLLHEDLWITPIEVVNWMRMIKDGHPEKVDWATLFWFMMEKELTQGEHLRDCFYASHFQYLIKSQREEVLLLREEDTATEKVELDVDVEAKEEEEDRINEEDVKVGVVGEGQEVEGNVMDGLSIELTLGQDVEVEDAKDAEMIGVDKYKEDDEMQEGEEQGRWDFDGKNNMGRHLMERCSMVEGRGFDSLEDRKEDERDMEEEEGEEGEDEAGHGLNLLSNVDALEENGLTGNLLKTMEANLMGFGSQGRLHDPDTVDLRADMLHMDSAAPFLNNTGKREIVHDNDIPNHLLNDRNKRLKINDTWDHKPVDFGTCIEQMQHFMERARVMYEEKEQAQEHLSMNQQVLLNELQKRDNMIEHLHKTKLEEIQKRDRELYRYEHELYLMGGVLDGYRKTLKETHKTFAEYRHRAQLLEESFYKDAEPGGLMLSTGEIEKLCKTQEEEYRMNCLILEQKAKEAEEGYTGQFEEFLEKINMLHKKLTSLETDAKELINYAQRKISETKEKVSEVLQPLSNE